MEDLSVHLTKTVPRHRQMLTSDLSQMGRSPKMTRGVLKVGEKRHAPGKARQQAPSGSLRGRQAL